MASAKPLGTPVQVMNVEVNFASDLGKHDLAGEIRQAVLDEQTWYAGSGKPVVIAVTVEKLSFRSAGKAVAENIPFVGMFAPANENWLRATVRVRDGATGAMLGEYRKVAATDANGLSAADAGVTALSFIPIIGDIAGAANDVARVAGNKREIAGRKMARNLATNIFSELYGRRHFLAVQTRKQDAAKAAKATRKPAPLTPPSSAVVAARQPATP